MRESADDLKSCRHLRRLLAGQTPVKGSLEVEPLARLRGHPDLADTIARLQAYQEAGADVLYAPGLADIEDIRRLVSSVDRPVNVLVRPGLASAAALAQAGVARISVGGAFSQVALAALTRAGRELLGAGTYGFIDLAAEGRQQAARAFGRP